MRGEIAAKFKRRLATIQPQLLRAAVHGGEVWISDGWAENMSQDMSEPFTLTIALPIANAEVYEGDLNIHAYEPVSAVTSHYAGPNKDLAAKGMTR